MREIKFRMFDTLEKVFMNESRIIESRISDLNKEGRFIYHQWTGLKDKNGKEIFEGDVVKGYWWKKGESHRHIGKVSYGMAAFKVVGVKQYLGISDELSPVYEVIGNIYENPELLEQTDEFYKHALDMRETQLNKLLGGSK